MWLMIARKVVVQGFYYGKEFGMHGAKFGHAYTPCKLLLDTTADDAAPFAVKTTAVRVAGLQRGDLGCVSDLSLAARQQQQRRQE
ncbi:unnamed protein product [Sphagnum jensenii]